MIETLAAAAFALADVVITRVSYPRVRLAKGSWGWIFAYGAVLLIGNGHRGSYDRLRAAADQPAARE